MHLCSLSACKRTKPLCPSRHSTPADIHLRRDSLQLTRQHLIAAPFLAAPQDSTRQVTCFGYRQLIPVIKCADGGHPGRGVQGGDEQPPATPLFFFFLQELCRGIVNFNEIEHLQRSFTGRLWGFWMWSMGWALTSRTVTSLFPPGPRSEWNRSQIKPHARVLMASSFQIPLNAARILP